jgi:GTPase SAR1 family protein
LHYKFWSCYIVRVAIVGLKESGKTEIKSKLREKGSSWPHTERIETHIFRLDDQADVFVALIDGMGADAESRLQQFQIAEHAQVLIVVLDHNSADNVTEILPTRLNEQSEFMNELRTHIKQTYGKPRLEKEKIRIILCLNKCDLWMKGEPGGILLLKNWFSDQVKEWRQLGISVSEKPFEVAAKTGLNIDIIRNEIIQSTTSRS